MTPRITPAAVMTFGAVLVLALTAGHWLAPLQRLKAADTAAVRYADRPVWTCRDGAAPVAWMPEMER